MIKTYKSKRSLDPFSNWRILVTPALALLIFATAYPIIFNFVQAFFYTDFTGQQMFVGLDNFIELYKSGVLYNLLKNTLIWAVGLVGTTLAIGFVAALVLNENFKGKAFFRVILMLPWAVTTVVAGLVWRLLLQGEIGMLNEILVKAGIIKSYIAWLGNTRTSLFAVMVAQVWQFYPFVMITMLAGMQSIPEDIFEAARIDGANEGQLIKYITIPQLFQVVKVIVILICIWSINAFDMVFVMTRGGPLHSSELLAMRIYMYAFEAGKFGMAAATAIVALIITLIFVIMYLKTFRVGEEEM